MGHVPPRRRRLGPSWVGLVAAAVAALPVGACAGGDGGAGGGSDRPGATVPDGEAASSSTTTSAAGAPALDIATKPATVTVEYADAVMDELDRILSDAIREFVAANGPTKGFDDKLNAVYDEPSLEIARSDYGSLAADGVDEFKTSPGAVQTSVIEILKAELGCVVLSTRRTFAELIISPQPNPRDVTYVALKPSSSESDPASLSETPWSVVFDGSVLEGDDPRAAC